MTPTHPAPHQVTSFKSAAENCVAWLRYWGYTDAHLHADDQNGAIDVQAEGALAGVRFEAKHVDTSTLQKLDAASQDESKQLFFFTGVGYDHGALDYADDIGIALFTYTIEGHVTPANDEARRLGHGHQHRHGNQAGGQQGQRRGAGAGKQEEEHQEDHSRSKETHSSQPVEDSQVPVEESDSDAISCLSVTIALALLGMAAVSLAHVGISLWGLFTGSDVLWWDALANLVLALTFFISIVAVPTGSSDPGRHALAFPFLLFCFMSILWGSAGHPVAAAVAGASAVLALIGWLKASRSPGPSPSPHTATQVEASKQQGGARPDPNVARQIYSQPRHQSHPAAMPLAEVPTFCRVHVLNNGSDDRLDDLPDVLDYTVPVWTDNEELETDCAYIPRRGVLDSTHGLVWLPPDAMVQIIDWVRFAGEPAEVVALDKPPAGQHDAMGTPHLWPPLITDSKILASAVRGDPTFQQFEDTPDAEASVETILCALTVAPDWDPTVREALIGALEVQYARVADDPVEYPPALYPWRQETESDLGVSTPPNYGDRQGTPIPDSQEK